MNSKYLFLAFALSLAVQCTEQKEPAPPSNGGGQFITDPIKVGVVGGACSNSLTVAQDIVSAIQVTSATVTGNFTCIDSKIEIIDYGHCWATSATPTISDNKTSYGIRKQTGTFTSSINNLQANTSYWVRLYVKYSNGKVEYHPNSIPFNTLVPASAALSFVKSVFVGDGGNNDGKISPNENPIFALTIANKGGAIANNVMLNLSANNSVISFPNSVISIGNIVPNGEGVANISLRIAPNAVWNTNIIINVRITDASGQIWNGEFNFKIESPYVVPNGLLFMYDFDNQNVNDALGNYHGAINGNIAFQTTTPNNKGLSAYFSNNSYITVATLNGSFSEQTISVWLKTNKITGGTSVTTTNRGTGIVDGSCFRIRFGIGLCADNKTRIATGTNTGIACSQQVIPTSINDNQWHLLTITQQSTETKFYFDGILFDRRNFGDRTDCNRIFTIGAIPNDFNPETSYYTGNMDNLRVYNRILTDSEVKEIFNAKQ